MTPYHCLADTLSNALDAEREVMAALDSANDESLWHWLRQHPDEDRLLLLVAEEAPRMAHRQRGAPRFSKLLLVPVIERNRGAVIGNTETWRGAEQCVSDALRVWQGQSGRSTVFRGVRPYQWIAAWEPSMLREHLLAAAPGASCRSLTFHSVPLDIPDEAPRLGFIVVAVTHDKGWPQLPPPDTLSDARFRDVVGHALTMSANFPTAGILPPDQFSAALADGLCLWLEMLHEAVPVTGWNMSPCATPHDAVQVTLSLHEIEASVQFNIRKHQLGPVGFDGIAGMLASLAPGIAGALST